MTAPNHIAGGFVFTGLFCSLFSVNVFASPLYVGFCVFCFLLPDIDHTKSIIGKIFYPIAKHIAQNYGHRTITHSLVFWWAATIFTLFLERNFSTNYNFTYIVFFGVFSHLMLDMVTISGIPLFYPFYKNPCVLPANPELRLHTGNLTQEGIALFIFACCTLFMQDLFANGFWSSINNSFGDIKHVQKEISKHTNPVFLNYDFSKNNQNFKGKGLLFYSSESKLFVYQNHKIIEINEKEPGIKINNLKTSKSNQKNTFFELNFKSISEDSVNKVLKNKFIISGIIETNHKTTLDNLEFKTKFNLSEKYNVNFISNYKDSLEEHKLQKINEIQIKIQEEITKIKIQDSELTNLNLKLESEKNKLNQKKLNYYQINIIKENIIEIEHKIKNFKPYESIKLASYHTEIENIKNQKSTIKYNGKLTGILLN